MGGAHDAEVTVIDGGDGVDTEPLSNGNDRCINEAEVEIGVAVDQLPGTLVIDGVEGLDAGVAAGEGGEERCLCDGADTAAEQPAHLDAHRGGHDDRSVVMVEAGLVVGVVAVSDGDEGSGVDDDRRVHESNSSRRIAL